MHSVAHWFHHLLYDFHLVVLPFLLQLLPKAVVDIGEDFTESEAPVHFILEVFDRIHVGGVWTPQQLRNWASVETFVC